MDTFSLSFAVDFIFPIKFANFPTRFDREGIKFEFSSIFETSNKLPLNFL